MKILEIASRQPWLIRAETLDVILDICSRDNIITAEVLDKIDVRKESLATQRGRKMDETRYTTRRENGVAVIDISGPIVRYADIFTDVSGGTSTQHLAVDFQMALADPQVRSIMLNIDSPGGEANGIHELANMIHAGRAVKPIYAYVGGDAASAAYWIASAADEIVTDRTAMLGSIGTVISVPDPTQPKNRRIEIVSKQSPSKRPDVTTEAGRSEIQRWADELATVFIDHVARNRGVTAETVTSEFGRGGMRIGQDAVDHGMADRLGSYESLIAELGRPRVAVAMVTPQHRGAKMKTNDIAAQAAEQPTITADAITPESYAALLSEVDGLKKLAAANEALAKAAEIEKLTTQAKAQVGVWTREGRLSGNSVAKTEAVYVAACTGQPVTRAAIEEMVAALPQLSTARIAADAKPTPTTGDPVTDEDRRRAAIDPAAARRVAAANAAATKK